LAKTPPRFLDDSDRTRKAVLATVGLDEDGNRVLFRSLLSSGKPGMVRRCSRARLHLTFQRPNTVPCPPSVPSNGTYKLLVRHKASGLDVSHHPPPRESETGQWTYKWAATTTLDRTLWVEIPTKSWRCNRTDTGIRRRLDRPRRDLLTIFDFESRSQPEWTYSHRSGYFR